MNNGGIIHWNKTDFTSRTRDRTHCKANKSLKRNHNLQVITIVVKIILYTSIKHFTNNFHILTLESSIF